MLRGAEMRTEDWRDLRNRYKKKNLQRKQKKNSKGVEGKQEMRRMGSMITLSLKPLVILITPPLSLVPVHHHLNVPTKCQNWAFRGYLCQGISTLTLLTFGARKFFVGRGCPVNCRMFIYIPWPLRTWFQWDTHPPQDDQPWPLKMTPNKAVLGWYPLIYTILSSLKFW